jgi:hypothetical protein
MAKQILVKNNVVIDVADASFEVHPDAGSWQSCSNDNVKQEWTVNSDGSVSAPVETPLTYAENRVHEYPRVGDVIDALFKKEAGDSSEWDALVTARTNTKNKYPKS